MLLSRIRRLKDPDGLLRRLEGPPISPARPKAAGSGRSSSFAGSADDAIVSWLKGQQRPHEVRVVTNDRELGGRVRSLHGKVASVEEFLKTVDPEQLEGREKPRITSNEARKWAEEFGVDPDAKV